MVFKHIMAIMVKKSKIVAIVVCISSGIIKIISDKYNTSQIWQTFLKSTRDYMKITYEICHSSENGFINSRTALKTLLMQEGLEVVNLKKDLELANFRELPRYPLFYTSLSHTKDLGAAVLVQKSAVKGIGIDIEWEKREIKPGAEKFFVHSGDQHQLTQIELWTAKEAAFKALSPMGSYPGVLVLSKIIIKENTFYTEAEPRLVGEFTVYHQNDFVFTIATISID
jgi:phosphopantetheinyl transferase (holo-ACP synthase)